MLFVLGACGSDGGKKGADITNGGDPSSKSGPSAPLTADEKACDDLYQAQIAWSHRCGGLLNESPYAVERFRKLCARELAASGTENLRESRARCVEIRKSSPCDAEIPECDLQPGGLEDGAACGSRSQCKSLFCKLDGTGCGRCAPLVAAGGECTSPADCAYGKDEIATCDYKGGEALTGTCSVWKLAKAGEECSAEKFCDIHSHCDTASEDAKTGKCVPNVAEGGACDDTRACKLGLVCRSGKCSQKPKEGQPCSAPDECADGLGCDQTCKKITYVGSGQECGATRRCERGLCVQRVEKGPDGKNKPAGPATCVDPIADGNACGVEQAQSGLVCDHFSRCIEGHCLFVDASACH